MERPVKVMAEGNPCGDVPRSARPAAQQRYRQRRLCVRQILAGWGRNPDRMPEDRRGLRRSTIACWGGTLAHAVRRELETTG